MPSATHQVVESVAGILFSLDRSQVLLIQRRDVPVWVLPGGGIDPGETPEEAIIREMQEETGLQVGISRLVGAYIPLNRLARHTHLYECMLIQGSLAITDETKDVRFFSLDALPSLIPPPYPEWIAESREFRPPVRKTIVSVTYLQLVKHLLAHPILVLRFLLARWGFQVND